MNAVVRVCFTDKYTQEVYLPGQKLKLTKKRFNEMRKANKEQDPDRIWIEEIE